VFSGTAGPGLYPVEGHTPEDLAEMAAGHGWVALVVVLASVTDKAGLLAAFADSGQFPEYTGRNWDALQDNLGDLSWLGPADGYLVVLTGWAAFTAGSPADAAVVESILATATAEWSARGTPFTTLVT
jgi:hypothetical protein